MFLLLYSAIILTHQSCRQPRKAVLMMEAAENRSRHDPHVPRQMMAGDRGSRQAGGWLREAWTETGVRAAAIVMDLPQTEDAPQVLLPERNQEIQALPA